MIRPFSRSLLVAALSASETAVAQQQSVAGTWKLVSYETVTPGGVRTFPLGEDAIGLLIYQPSGRMSVQFMRRDRPKFKSGDAWRGSLEEERAAFEGFFSYAGRYTVDAGTRCRHASHRDLVGAKLCRHRR